MKRWIMVAALIAVGCGSGEESKLGDRGASVTKSEARASGGVDADGEDLCAELDWYDDGICDDFCVEPDLDCDTANNDPTNNTPTNNDPTNNTPTNNVSGADCGGLAGLVCGDDEFCNYPDDSICGAADQLGTCEPRPDACAEIYQPVCGCDGNDYGNACSANGAGVDVAAEGTCGGDICAADSDCAAAEVCVDGACVPSVGCAADSDCAAGEICIDGACEADPGADVCGGIAGFTCATGYFCDWAADQMCGAADQLGTCELMPDVCPDIYQPVCGCDGMTYSNDCDANAAGISVAADGECALTCQANTDCPADQLCTNGTCTDVAMGQCGGFAGFVCADDEWCDYPDTTMCGAADQIGTCKPRPDACITVYDPVCGCDGVTYSNSCLASSAGVDVATTGVCPN